MVVGDFVATFGVFTTSHSAGSYVTPYFLGGQIDTLSFPNVVHD